MAEAIKLYLKDIKHIPLLTAEEEVDLAKKIKRGDEAARRKMIYSNLRLVINIAKRYSYLGMPMLDLVEEGNLGLMKAVEKFNYKKGYRFSTYASWWVKQYITRAIANQGKTIRVPVYMAELIMRFKRASERLSHKFGRRPRFGEIAKEMKVPAKKVRQINKMVTKISSLDAPIGGEDGQGQMMDLIEDENIASPTDEVSDFLRQERVRELLERLSERERRILVLRYGLKDGHTRTLGETARYFSITRERVRQIESAALKKLKVFIKEQEDEVRKEEEE